MIKFFEYNWKVRDEWFDWCDQVATEELIKERSGGVGSILYTFFHIIDVEYSWIRGIQSKEDVTFQFEDYNSLRKVKSLSNELRNEIAEFLQTNLDDLKEKVISVSWDKEKYTADEILHHIIAHEIHHIGQLSVWSRELGLQPVSASFIGKEINSIYTY